MESRRLIIASLLFLLAGPAALSAAPKKAAPAELNLARLDGVKASLHDFRGKIVVVNFWATWCGPCKAEMPMLVEASRKWSAKGVTFVGASLDEGDEQKNIADFVKKFQIRFPVWVGAAEGDMERLGMGEALPATAFLDENGTILLRVQGKMKRAELEQRLAWLTGDRSKPSPKALQRNQP